MKYRSQSMANPNACGWSGVPRVAASGLRSVPRIGPYHSGPPSRRRGPSQILRMMSASTCVITPHSPACVPMRPFGSNVQRRGSSITPSLTPSLPSHAAIAAEVAAASLHDATGFALVFISIVPQNDCINRFVQLIAGAADTMPL
jgi:hypothetical protein